MSYFYEEKVGVAILDTGIYPHKDFENRIVCFKDFVNGKEEMYDDNGHGTHVAGIIAGNGIVNKRYKGVAPKSNIIALKILDEKGNGDIEKVLDATKWIMENSHRYNIRVVNISLGGKPKKNKEYTSKEMKIIESVEMLWDKGFVVVAAAGNNGPKSHSITIPGVSKKVITVGNSGEISDRKNSSGRGPTFDMAIKPDIVVYGNNIISCNNKENGYTIKSGTSMSTPIVSGTVANMLMNDKSLTNDKVKLMLQNTAIDLGQDKNVQGFGLLNIEELKGHMLYK